MATVTPVASYEAGQKQITWTWTGIVTGDTVVAAEIIHNPSDLVFYASGTFANGTVLTWSGSVDDTNFVTSLVNPAGTIISLTAVGGDALRDGWRYLKPAVASGSSDSVTVKLMARIAP